MDIYTYLVRDHQHIAELFNQVVDTTDIPLRRGIYEQIKSDLLAYMAIKETVFYGELSGVANPVDTEHGRHAHAEIRSYLNVIGQTPMTDEKWIEQFGELKHAYAHMIAVEERVIFAAARDTLTAEQASGLVDQAERRKSDAMIQAS